jgi:thymidine phosphorylase
MPSSYPWNSPTSPNVEKVGLFSIGSLEEKIPFALHPFLLSTDLAIGLYKKFDYPIGLSHELIREIKSTLKRKDLKYVIFDLRIHNWTNARYVNRMRLFSQSLKDDCSELGIGSTMILSNGGQLLGKAVGVFCEMIEAYEVWKGMGPPDLTKFTLEIAADLLMMGKRSKHRQEAKKWLRDRIISQEFSDTASEALKQAAPFFGGFEKRTLCSSKDGYVHHLEIKRLHSIKSKLTSAHPGTGFILLKKTGDWIGKGSGIFEVCIPTGKDIPVEAEDFRKTLVISDDPPQYQPFILERLGPNRFS